MAYTRGPIFEPISLQERLIPILQYAEEYDKLAEEYSKLQAGTERWKSEAENDPEVAAKYKDYSDALNRVVEDFSQGMTSRNNRGALIGLRKGYVENILPIETAYGIKSDYIKRQDDARAKDDTVMFTRDARDISLGEIMKNNHIGYGAQSSGATIRRAAKEASQNLSKRFRALEELDVNNLPDDAVLKENYGVTQGELLLFKSGDPRFLQTDLGQELLSIVDESITSTNLYNSLELPDQDEDGNYIFSDDPAMATKQRRSLDLYQQMSEYAQQGVWDALGTSKISYRHKSNGTAGSGNSGSKKNSPIINPPMSLLGVEGDRDKDSEVIDDLVVTPDGRVSTTSIKKKGAELDEIQNKIAKKFTPEQVIYLEETYNEILENLKNNRDYNQYKTELKKLVDKGYNEWRALENERGKKEEELQKEIENTGNVTGSYAHLVENMDGQEAVDFLKNFVVGKTKYINHTLDYTLKSDQNKELVKSIRDTFNNFKSRKDSNGVYLLDNKGRYRKEIGSEQYKKLFKDANLDRIRFHVRATDDKNKPAIVMSLEGTYYGFKGDIGIKNANDDMVAIVKFINDFSKESIVDDKTHVVNLGDLTIEDVMTVMDQYDLTSLLDKAEDLGSDGSGLKGITIESNNIPGKYLKVLFLDKGDGNGYKPIHLSTAAGVANYNKHNGKFIDSWGTNILKNLYTSRVIKSEEGEL